MKIKVWHEGMSDKETKDLAYWERNMLALLYADGWYNDDVISEIYGEAKHIGPRYPGWRRVLTLKGGKVTFHIPDDFDVGTLLELKPNWDGHTTEEKWRWIAAWRNVEVDNG